jgi:hypothetical protein
MSELVTDSALKKIIRNYVILIQEIHCDHKYRN